MDIDETPRTLSELLEDLKPHLQTPEVSIKLLLEAFHERGFGFFLFLIALPAALPLPALGINTIIALPLLILTGQQAIGRHTIWLPASWKAKTVKSANILKFIDIALPWVKKIELFVKPRLSFMTQGIFSYLIGITGVLLSLAVAIPLPLTNTVPAFGIALMSIGVLTRDGLAVLAGAFIGILWVIALVSFVVIFGSMGFEMMKDFIKGFL